MAGRSAVGFRSRGIFGCLKVQSELSWLFVDRNRLPSPAGLVPAGSDRLSPVFRYYAVLRLLSGHRLSFFRSTGYRSRGARQISLSKTNKLRDHPVATTCSDSNRFWTSPLAAGSSIRPALRRFTFVRFGHAPITSTAPPLAGLATLTLRESCGRPQQGTCFFGVGFPLSGPRVRTFTSGSLFMSVTRLTACRLLRSVTRKSLASGSSCPGGLTDETHA